MTSHQLSDITRGLHHAASTTSAMVAQQYILMLDQFFDVMENGSLKAKMVRVDIDEKHFMMVPLISLAMPKGLALEKMRVEMSIRMDEVERKKATSGLDNSEATRSSFKVTLSPKSKSYSDGLRSSDIVDVEMEFNACPPPEGIMRIIDQYANMIQPIPEKNKKPDNVTNAKPKTKSAKINAKG
ncbi:DUF2589 domain-containing protein [Candidatus Magnetomoraceae bacterium gMMP-15]